LVSFKRAFRKKLAPFRSAWRTAAPEIAFRTADSFIWRLSGVKLSPSPGRMIDPANARARYTRDPATALCNNRDNRCSRPRAAISARAPVVGAADARCASLCIATLTLTISRSRLTAGCCARIPLYRISPNRIRCLTSHKAARLPRRSLYLHVVARRKERIPTLPSPPPTTTTTTTTMWLAGRA